VLLAGLGVWVDSRLNRVDALADYQGRPAATPGADWLIVGSDSRQGLDEARRRELGTGQAAGRRADTMMLLHIPRGTGKPILISLPRDSYVPIPGHDPNKLNAAYAFGGLNVKAGCQVASSKTALAYVRARHSGRGDLDRVQRQQEFLGALIKKSTSPATVLNPFRSVPLLLRGTEAVAVDQAAHVWNLVRFPFAMRAIGNGSGIATIVPVAGTETISGAGSVVRWDRERALALFEALKQDQPVDNLVDKAG
jgi:anionic cell wall polymer biosynthesis LytR-Cps2A-Psr (LCP) family protein